MDQYHFAPTPSLHMLQPKQLFNVNTSSRLLKNILRVQLKMSVNKLYLYKNEWRQSSTQKYPLVCKKCRNVVPAMNHFPYWRRCDRRLHLERGLWLGARSVSSLATMRLWSETTSGLLEEAGVVSCGWSSSQSSGMWHDEPDSGNPDG